MSQQLGEIYDVAVSFAGEQREIVKRYVDASRALDLRVFYDADMALRVWGEPIATTFRKVYGNANTRFFVPFISEDYLRKGYPMDELQTAIATQLGRGATYILPVKVGDVVIPEELLSGDIGYLAYPANSESRLAELTLAKVRGSSSAPASTAPSPRPLRVPQPFFRAPRLPPTSFSKQAVLEEALTWIAQQFRNAEPGLRDYGFAMTTRSDSRSVLVVVERQGQNVCQMRLAFSDSVPDGGLAYQFGWQRITGNGINGKVDAEWDVESNQGKLRFSDYTSSGRDQDRLLTKEELADRLWETLVGHVESWR